MRIHQFGETPPSQGPAEKDSGDVSTSLALALGHRHGLFQALAMPQRTLGSQVISAWVLRFGLRLPSRVDGFCEVRRVVGAE